MSKTEQQNLSECSENEMKGNYVVVLVVGPIGHFRVPPGLCFKTRVGGKPLIRKSFFIVMQTKLIFTRKVVHLASF